MRYTRHLLALLTLPASAALTAAAAGAQAVHPFSLGISAGASFLSGDNRKSWNDGFAAQGTVAVGFPVLPVQLRADVGYQTFQGKPFQSPLGGPSAGGTIPDFSVWSGTLSLVARPSGELGLGIVRPYLSAGGGAYRSDRARAVGTGSAETDWGVTGALGASVPVAGLNAFFEVRVHHVVGEGDALRTYPVVAGFLF